MGGGIISVLQPTDRLMGKIFKEYYREFYHFYILSAPCNDNGQRIVPIRQLCAKWVVYRWDKVTEELIKTSQDISGYKNIHELHNIEIYIHRNINEYENKKMLKF